jgi:cation transport ATPase
MTSPQTRGRVRPVGSGARSPGRAALAALVESRAQGLTAVAGVAIAAGFLLHAIGAGDAGHQVWRAAVALLAAELAVEVVHTIAADHHLGVDTIALVAMAGALALGEELAGAVIGLMFTSGAALEAVASRRARRDLTLLVQRAPRVARLRVGGGIQEVPVDRIRAGDTVLVRTGEVVPVDGTVAGGEAVVDTSTLSGEPLPVTLPAGTAVLSGSAGRRSTCAPAAPRRRAHTRRWCGSWSRRRPSGRRSCGWPTATRGSSCRSRCWSPVWPGR